MAVTKSSVDLLTDDELREKFGLSKTTFREMLRNGPPRKQHCRSRDIRLINNFCIGGKRFWLKDDYEKFIRGEI